MNLFCNDLEEHMDVGQDLNVIHWQERKNNMRVRSHRKTTIVEESPRSTDLSACHRFSSKNDDEDLVFMKAIVDLKTDNAAHELNIETQSPVVPRRLRHRQGGIPPSLSNEIQGAWSIFDDELLFHPIHRLFFLSLLMYYSSCSDYIYIYKVVPLSINSPLPSLSV